MEKEFIPEITINNKSERKEVEIDGAKQIVEVPAKKGFNIRTKNLSGEFSKEYFQEEIEAVILFDRYKIQSKYNSKPMYGSNEFEFSGDRNKLRVYSYDEKQVLYEGDYAGAKEAFATGEMSPTGTPKKSFDVFSILYIAIGEEVYRFKQKMNQNNLWFDYKSNTEDSRDDKNFRGINTKFDLEKKQFGDNEFWVCTLQNIGVVKKEDYDTMAEELEKELDKPYEKPVDLASMGTEVKVEDIPF